MYLSLISISVRGLSTQQLQLENNSSTSLPHTTTAAADSCAPTLNWHRPSAVRCALIDVQTHLAHHPLIALVASAEANLAKSNFWNGTADSLPMLLLLPLLLLSQVMDERKKNSAQAAMMVVARARCRCYIKVWRQKAWPTSSSMELIWHRIRAAAAAASEVDVAKNQRCERSGQVEEWWQHRHRRRQP